MNTTDTDTELKKPKPVTISLDGELITVPDRTVTPNEILALAKLDVSTHYLVKVKGRDQTSYQGKGDDLIKVKDGEVFISLSTGPTPTS